MDLTADEKRVMGVLGNGGEDFGCYSFDPISRAAGIPIDRVRTACRSLRDKCLVEYHRNLFTEDGEMYGAGYGATAAGRALASTDKSIPYLEAE
jgi:hypothetical protein